MRAVTALGSLFGLWGFQYACQMGQSHTCLAVRSVVVCHEHVRAPLCLTGKAARVGGEPGITRAVMSRVQVGPLWPGTGACGLPGGPDYDRPFPHATAFPLGTQLCQALPCPVAQLPGHPKTSREQSPCSTCPFVLCGTWCSYSFSTSRVSHPLATPVLGGNDALQGGFAPGVSRGASEAW